MSYKPLFLSLFCTDLAALGQDLGPIFFQYGPRAWLIRCINVRRQMRRFIKYIGSVHFDINLKPFPRWLRVRW